MVKVVQQVIKGVLAGCTVLSLSMVAQPLWWAQPLLAESLMPIEASTTTENLLVSIRRQGGMCRPPGCFSEVTIFLDGTYRYTTHLTDPVMGHISDTELRMLRDRITKPELEQLRINPHSGESFFYSLCALAADGPETIYTFNLEGQEEVLQGCRTPIDTSHPLVQQLERLFEEIITQADLNPVSSPEPTISPTPAATVTLPRRVTAAVRKAMRNDYQNRLTNIQINHATAATWLDCQPDLPNHRFSYHTCEPTQRDGWRVTVTAEFIGAEQQITRVYYADRHQVVTPDRLSSLTETDRLQLATHLHLEPSSLQLLAAQELSFYPATACPEQGPCPIPPLGLGWRTLVSQNGQARVAYVNSWGAPLHTEARADFFSDRDRNFLGDLPLSLANAVVRDAQERINTDEFWPTPNPEAGIAVDFQVESVTPVTWNWCRGGGPGPSPVATGTCPDITVSGWQMIVVGGLKQNPWRFVYYIPEGSTPNSFLPTPDGLQSLTNSIRTQILETIATEAGVPISQLQIRWAEARFFDRCLSVNNQAVSCQTAIRPGWQIEVFNYQPNPDVSWATPLWTYHTNLSGTDVRLVNQSYWTPPPSAPPANEARPTSSPNPQP